jgi:hypothetical protein
MAKRRARSRNRLFVRCAALTLCACWTGQSSVVREKAAFELRCDEASIKVSRSALRRKEDLGLSNAVVYRVEGCGHLLFYKCDGWDSYEQKSLCEPQPGSN